jgi:hypothetical protein
MNAHRTRNLCQSWTAKKIKTIFWGKKSRFFFRPKICTKHFFAPKRILGISKLLKIFFQIKLVKVGWMDGKTVNPDFCQINFFGKKLEMFKNCLKLAFFNFNWLECYTTYMFGS